MGLTFAAIAFTAIVSTALPVAALILLRVKKKTGLLAGAFGAVGFFLFALVLEQLLHSFVLPKINAQWLYVLYGCFAAGIFEETSRLAGLSLLKRLNKSSSFDALAYGIGHGGIEAVLLVGVGYIIQLGYMFVPNGELLLAGAPVGLYFIAGVERIMAMLLHICLTMLIWTTVSKRGPKWIYPACICLHALANLGATMAQAGITNNIAIIYSSIILSIILSLLLFVEINKKSPVLN